MSRGIDKAFNEWLDVRNTTGELLELHLFSEREELIARYAFEGGVRAALEAIRVASARVGYIRPADEVLLVDLLGERYR